MARVSIRLKVGMTMQMGGTFFAGAWDAAVLDISPT